MVGRGKTFVATVLARILEDDLGQHELREQSQAFAVLGYLDTMLTW